MGFYVKYAGNTTPGENTAKITRDNGPDIELGGVGELSDEEYAVLAPRLNLEVLDEGSDEVKAYKESLAQQDQEAQQEEKIESQLVETPQSSVSPAEAAATASGGRSGSGTSGKSGEGAQS